MPTPSGARHLWVEGYREAVCGAHGHALLVSRRIEKVTCRRCLSTKEFAKYALGAALVAAGEERSARIHS